jgi:hypothetical protein
MTRGELELALRLPCGSLSVFCGQVIYVELDLLLRDGT